MTHVRYVFALTVLSAGVLAPTGASAAVVFTEVMYDVPGTDTGREWIEVQNTGSDTVDLSGWKLFEANTNHALTLSQGAGIAPGGFAVIADTPSKFLTDWPTFSGPIFDSSFSLSNSGEALVLRNDSGADVASLTYDPTIGAAGDGNTLQWNGSSWVAALATPGSAYVSGGSSEEDTPPTSDDSSNVESTSDDSQTTTASGGSAPLPKKIFADAGPDRTLFVGADYAFTATAIGLTGDPLEGARYVWNFDDGGSAEGSAVSYRYLYPGTYHLVLDVSSGRYATTDRATITVVPAQISIPSVTDTFVSIENKSRVELDLGGWMLFADGKSFVFPQHTIVAAGETVIVSNERTGLSPSSPKALSLLYPNGAFAASYDVPLIAERIPANAQAPESTTTPLVSAAPKDTPAKKVSASVSKPKTTATSSQAAAALLAEQGAGGGGNFMLWIGALGLLVLGAVGGTFFFQGKGGEKYSVTD